MTNYFANGSTGAYLNFRKSSLISGYLFHMQKFVKGHLRFFFVGDESPEPIQSSKVQNQCQLLKGSPATFLTVMGEILSIFIWFSGFHRKILMIMTFGLHFGLDNFYIL